MNCSGLYSLIPDAPDSFCRRVPTSAEMKQGLIVFIATSYEQVLKSTVGVYPGVEGVVVSKAKSMTLKEIRPTLWHVSITDDMVHCIHAIAELLLSLVKGQVQSRELLQKEMTLTRDVALELQNKNQLLDGITSNFPGIIYQFSVDGNNRIDMSYISDGAFELLGISPGELNIFEKLLARIRPDEQAKFVAGILDASRHDTSWQAEVGYTSKDGGVIRLRWVASITDGAGIRICNGVILDISEEIRIKEMLVQSEKMMSIGGLAAGMAHEINNPLAGLMHSIQVIQNRLATNHPDNLKAAYNNSISLAPLKGYLEDRAILKTISRMKEACYRVSTIVLDMLSFARAGGHEFQKRDICKLLDQTINIASTDYDLSKNFDFRRINIVRHYQEGIPKVDCVPSKLQQVFINILRNGAQAMSEPPRDSSFSPEFTLDVAFDRRRNWLTVRISDNGPGIPSDVQYKIFEPFYTTKETGEGTGLGLSVSYFIMTREHGGELSVESIPGKGSCFILGLPADSTFP